MVGANKEGRAILELDDVVLCAKLGATADWAVEQQAAAVEDPRFVFDWGSKLDTSHRPVPTFNLDAGVTNAPQNADRCAFDSTHNFGLLVALEKCFECHLIFYSG